MYPLLTAEQELLLAERIAHGDLRARQHLIEANFVWWSVLLNATLIKVCLCWI